MARRKDIAGLAALGALGMMLNRKGESSDSGGVNLGEASDYANYIEGPDRNENFSNEGRGPLRNIASAGRASSGSPTKRPASVNPELTRTPGQGGPRGTRYNETDSGQGRIAGQGGPRGTRYNEVDPSQTRIAGQGGPRGTRYNETTTAPAAQSTRRLNSAEALAELDRQTGVRAMDPNADRGPNAITSTELGRNVSNTLGALTPIGGGVGKVAAELPYMGRAQKAYNQRAALRRSEEGLNADEAAAAQERIRQASFDGGMKRGGKVKKMASGGMTKVSASSRGDGIAMRGKTRGMMR